MDTPLLQALSETLKIANVRARLSYDDLAEKSGLSRSTVTRLFAGRRMADLDQIDALAVALGVDAIDLARDIYARAEQLRDTVSGDAPSVTDAMDIADEVHGIDASKKETYGLAAKRGRRKADIPHAE